MKKFLVTLIAMLPLTLMISCGDSGDDCENLDSKCDGTVAMTCLAGKWEKEDCAEKNQVCDLVMEFATCVDATDDNDLEPDVDEVSDVDIDDSNPDTDIVCTLDSTWMTPEDSWTSWGYLKIMGEIGDYSGDYVEAVFTDGKIALSDTTTELIYGSVQNYEGSVLIADASNYEFTNVNQSAGTATIDYWDAMYQLSQALIPAMKEQGATEAGFGATVWFRHTFIDVNFDTASGKVTAQRVRKNCFVGLSKTEEQTDGTDTYDVPIGNMYGCFDANVDGSVGEELKIMFKNEFTEDEATMLEFFNTQSDGTVLQYGAVGYTQLCTCYNEKGASETEDNELNCWNEYDGPGGAEDCPAAVEAAGECGTVEPDEDIIDSDTNDVDTDADVDNYINPCTPTNTCVEAHQTVCTDANTDGVAECACDADYHFNGSNVCISNTKTESCVDNAPANATSTVADVDVTWNGTGWNTAADCAWTCDDGYTINNTSDGCDQNPI